MQEFIITFREFLEASLVVGIIYGYLKKSNNTHYIKYVNKGIFLGAIGSIFGALLFHSVLGGFTGVKEQIFEGTTMAVGAVLMLFFIIWMSANQNIREKLSLSVDGTIQRGGNLALMLLVFFSILREGVETTIFLNSIALDQNSFSFMFSSLGVAAGVTVGYLVYKGAKYIKLRYIFAISSFIFVFFAAGLLAHSVHEFQEAGILPIFIEQVWDTNHILSEESMSGSFFKALFGYNANPSLLEVFLYVSTIVLIFVYNFYTNYINGGKKRI
jgi:high-affinity iron transporter